MEFGRALIVTDRDDWADRAVRACARVGLMPERIPWVSAGRGRRLPVLALADLDSDLPEKRRHLEHWADDRGRQPVAVICVRARVGAAELVEHLEELGYRRFHFVARRVDWAAVEPDVEEVWERPEMIEDLRVPPGNRLEALKGDRKGQHSIRINQRYRICFRWTEAGAREVEIVDYRS